MSHLINNPQDSLFLLFLFVVMLLYLLPTFIAFGRRHHNRWQILVGNLLLGWTFFIWCYLVVLAISPDVREVE